MPATAVSGAPLPTYEHYFSRMHGLHGLKMNYGIVGNSAVQQFLPPNPNWSFGGVKEYGFQTWPLAGSSSAFTYPGGTNQQPEVPKGWRDGDWMCNCGFHNYSSRSQCKQCNAPSSSAVASSTTRPTAPDLFPTLGTKRLASEEFVNEWDNKRLHAGDIGGHFLHKAHEPHLYQVSEQPGGTSYDQARGLYSRYPSGNLATAPPSHAAIHPAQFTLMPPLLGKGAKQWRDGDWMCNNCSNHNFASRSSCNRCKTEKETAAPPVSVA